jgi:hypothetical protein
MKNLQMLVSVLECKGFDFYLSTKSLQYDEKYIVHDIYTCTNGVFSGEVVDIHYNLKNQEIKQVEVSSQFHTNDGGEYLTTPKILNFI